MFKSIKFKLIALPALPLLVALYFMVTGIAAKYKTVDEMDDILTLSRLAVKISALVHETQKERGATGLFMGSDGTKFVTELPAQRKQTDLKRADLKEFLESIDPDSYGREFSQALNLAVNKMAMIDEHRIKVSNQSITAKEGLALYTQHNGLMLDVVSLVSKASKNAEMGRTASAYVNYLQGKERAGIERAVMSKTFAADRFEEGALRRFGFLVSAQQNYFDVFRSLATSSQIAFYEQKMSAPVVAEVQRMRDIAFEIGVVKTEGFGVDPGHWFKSMTQKINLMKEVENRLSEDLSKRAAELKADARSTLILLGLIALAVVIGVVTAVYFMTRSITRPINRIISGLSEGADQMASASGQVSSASQQLAEGSSEQAASIEETSSSLEEMSSMTKQNADHATQANNLMKEANSVVGHANNSMTDLTTSMEDISRASQETSKIIKTIDEIAFQTNLLALNAAVEAARAGEAGAGFAVVADEVRNLAMRAADAAKNTAELIEGTVKKTKGGSELVTKTNEAFSEVATSAAKVGELVGEIAAASNEQAQGIEQVNTAVAEMDKVVQQNAANAEENASASEEMSAQAEQMKGYVGELVVMVGQSRNGKGQAQTAMLARKPKTEALPDRPAHPTVAKTKGVAALNVKEVTPDQVIPLEDDFKDF